MKRRNIFQTQNESNVELNKNLFSNFDTCSDLSGQNRIKTVLEILEGYKVRKVLDIGCASGEFLFCLPKEVEKHGVDLHKRDLERIKYTQADISQGLPFPNNFFDLVTGIEVIEHILDTDYFLSECYRVLVPDGLLLLTTPNTGGFQTLVSWIKKDQFWYFGYDNSSSMGHVRAYSVNAIKTQLRKHKFKIDKLITWHSGVHALLPRYLLPIAKRLFPMRGEQIFVLAQRSTS